MVVYEFVMEVKDEERVGKRERERGKKEIEWGKKDRGKERDSGRAEVSRVNNDLTLWLW